MTPVRLLTKYRKLVIAHDLGGGLLPLWEKVAPQGSDEGSPAGVRFFVVRRKTPHPSRRIKATIHLLPQGEKGPTAQHSIAKIHIGGFIVTSLTGVDDARWIRA